MPQREHRQRNRETRGDEFVGLTNFSPTKCILEHRRWRLNCRMAAHAHAPNGGRRLFDGICTSAMRRRRLALSAWLLHRQDATSFLWQLRARLQNEQASRKLNSVKLYSTHSAPTPTQLPVLHLPVCANRTWRNC